MKKIKQEWHWHPTVPLENNPLFKWPLSFTNISKWYLSMWAPLSETVFCLIIAFISFYLIYAPLSNFQNFQLNWILQIHIINLIIILLVAGGLHIFFYKLKIQKKEFKYDSREFSNNKVFTFNSQLLDNMFWTLFSGVTFWTFYLSIFLWSYSNGLAPIITFYSNPFWFCLLFFFIILWESFHFYFMHRLLHIPIFYKLIHHIHHRNVDPGPWSGISMHPVEHLFYFSSVLIHFIVPSNPMHVVFHLIIMTVGAVIGHCGFDRILINKKNKIYLGHFHHQLHHRYFECNYGTIESPCDVWFNSFHDGTTEASKKMSEKHFSEKGSV